jgi:putative acetyltransferase
MIARMAEIELALRAELPSDVAAIERVQRLAFQSEAEPRIVNDLRDADGLLLSLVALHAGEVVGHIAFSPVTLHMGATIARAVGLGPVAVLPEHQRRGIGARMIEEGLERLRRAGHRVVFVLGHREYYPRFGFVPAYQRGFRWEHDAPREAFMVRELEPGALLPGPGIVRYLPEVR